MTAEARRREVLLRIRDVCDTVDGPRLYENMSKSRSVRDEVAKLLRDGLIEPVERDGEHGYRRTLAGERWLQEGTGVRS